MKVKDIDKYFPLEILRRGYDYYKRGKVKEIIKINNGFVANVSGSDIYKVTIDVSKKHYDMKCTCPYAEDFNCKHMAAVLYCLKNNALPIKKNNIKIQENEMTDFEKFKRNFRREYNKLFHNRSYIHENELEEYNELINSFIKETVKNINHNNLLAYEIFEYFLIEIDSLDVYDQYGEKENMFENLFESFKQLFEDERIFVKLLSFVGMIYTIDTTKFYFEHKDEILNLMYYYINYKWQAEDVLILLRKLENNKDIADYRKKEFKIKTILINYYFIDKNEAEKIALNCLDINEVCEFLLDLHKNNESKQIWLLEKMIYANKGYSNEKYFLKLISIYKKKDKQKYLDLLDKYFIEHQNIDTYRQIKNSYSKDEWNKKKIFYLEKVKNSRVYIDICIEEEYYDELLKYLEDEWIEMLNKYLEILVKHRPKETLQLYKNKILTEIDRASCRQHYQKVLSYFENLLKIPKGKNGLKEIINYVRESYKNKKALQEEIDFFEETYI